MQIFIFHKGFTKYNKTNGMTFMKTLVKCAPTNLFAQKKLWLNEKHDHRMQLPRKKKVGPFGYAISRIFVQQTFIKKCFDITKFYKNLYGLIKYNKTNGITPMKIVWNVHFLSCLLKGSCGSMKNMIIVNLAIKKEKNGSI